MEIIIFILVISVISNIIKAVGKSKSVQPRVAGGQVSSNLYEVRTSENKMERESPKNKLKVQNPILKVAKTSQAKQQVKPQDNPQDEIQMQNTLQPNPESSSQSKTGLANLTPNRLVEGIILSEILAPPKSRR